MEDGLTTSGDRYNATLLAAAGRGKPSPLCVDLSGIPREDIKECFEHNKGGRQGRETTDKGMRAWRLTIRRRRRGSAWIETSCAP